MNIEGKESIRTSGNGIENAILEIFGKNYLKNFSKFSLGFLGNANLFKANRDSIFVFINGRSVKSKIIEEAVIAAYHTKLMKGKYPTALIFLNIDPSDIDVNVHPSKKIVKFANQNEVYDLVKGEIDRFFTDDEEFISPHIEAEEKDGNFEEISNEKDFSLPQNTIQINDYKNLLNIEDFKTVKKEITPKENLYSNFSQQAFIKKEDYSKKDIEHIENEKKIMESVQEKISGENETLDAEIREEFNYSQKKLVADKAIEKIESLSENKYIFKEEDTNRGIIFDDFTDLKNIDFKVIGQVFDTFILVERNGLLEIYDQHIIHERILYEKLKQEYYNKTMSKQNLLVPIRFELDPREKQLALENLEIFSSFGFDIDDFDRNEILVRSIPTMNLRDSYENIIREILDNISKNKDVDIRENIIISMSCKGAIKANHKLTLEEMYSMVAKLHEVGEYTCPHGRPIIVKMSLLDLEKLFKRK